MCRTKEAKYKKKEKFKKKIRQLDETDSEDDEDQTEVEGGQSSDESECTHQANQVQTIRKHIFAIDSDKSVKINCAVGGVKLSWIVDSGAGVNVINEASWKFLKKHQCKVSYESTDVRKKLVAYGDHKLKVKGVFKADFSTKFKTIHDEIYVIQGAGNNLLGRKTAMELGILEIKSDLAEIKSKPVRPLGKFKDLEVKLNINKKIQPVHQSCRRIPIPLQGLVENELKNLMDQDVIELAPSKVSWVSPLVVRPKNGGKEVRICVDMRSANKAIIPDRHPLPTFDGIMPYLNGCRVFSKLDLRKAFHQIELSPESREITTFVTHSAFYRYKRLMFGMNCASEIFQREMERILKGLKGVRNFIDDVLIYGRTVQEHDRHLAAVRRRFAEHGIELNEEKCQIRKKSVTFMGHELSPEGILPMEDKLGAIRRFRKPDNISEMRSFLGLVTYVGKFIPNLSAITAPLRQMIKKGTKYEWSTDKTRAFEKVKAAISDPQHLGYYNPNNSTLVITDASSVAVGAVLVQLEKGIPRAISYASKSLSPTEKRYFPLEREALAIVWALEKFEVYLRGLKFTLVTDHQPLETLFGEKSVPSARIERWVLKLQSFRFSIVYVPGKLNIADPLSRLCRDIPSKSFDKGVDEMLCSIVESGRPAAITMTDIIEASEIDNEILHVKRALYSEKWTQELQKYKAFKNELSCIRDVLLRVNKIVVPVKLRSRVLELGHTGHPGCGKMKRRIRASLWWPGVDSEVEKFCKSCLECQAVGRNPVPEPLHIRNLPSKPWSYLCADILGPLPCGKSILVVIDYYSRYQVVEVVTKVTSSELIKRFRRIFTELGRPDVLATDNATYFSSTEFKDCFVDMGVKLTKTTPYWPRANGEVERQNRSLLKILRISNMKHTNWMDDLQDYLYMYSATPHSITGVSPAELMFGRRFKDVFPHFDEDKLLDDEIRDRDKLAKQYSKDYYDDRNSAKESNVEVGSSVLMKNMIRENKLTPLFDPTPAEVIDVQGNAATIRTPEGQEYRRNCAHLKLIPMELNAENSKNQAENHDQLQKERVAEGDSLPTMSTRSRRTTKKPKRYDDYSLD
ncbi:uncharacterized protein K02A2.6-like [Malaya genurostris]|uniref:uncharacterized protein K02A2.6-like n=1 Tax=Malaya genurostris TaxID=325434 RepID=UPI0026F3A996|nr:uncharacterized protein K02A2.6-like [Malaya genurostris]